MSPINSESNELKILRQEVEELRKSKKQSTGEGNKGIENEKKEDKKSVLASALREETLKSSKSLDDLTTYAEDFVLELKDVTKERPVLALLGAFTLGILACRLFSRK